MDGAENMARDEALMRACAHGARPTLRLYGWKRPTLSLGAHQPGSDADLRACRERGVDLVRRPTGGGAVLHHLEVTYSVSGRLGEAPLPSSVLGIYDRISEALVAGLGRLGVGAEAVRASSRGRAPADCFKAQSAREIVVHGRKLVGSAQVRRKGVFLQHGSVLLDLDRALLAIVLRPGRERDGTGEPPGGPGPMTLLEALGRSPSRDEVHDAIAAGFTAALGCVLEPGALTEEEAALVASLRAFKYLDAVWTLEGREREASGG